MTTSDWQRLKIGAFSALALMSTSAAAVTIDTDGKLAISADDGSFAARLSARVHADANMYSSDVIERDSGAFIRRARIGVSGHVRNWSYNITFDNATDAADLKDAYLARVLGPGRLIIGQFKQFQGFEELTSSNDIALIERSHVSNAMTARAIGVGYHGRSGDIGWAVSGYNLREAADGGSRATDDGFGAVTRVYAAPFAERDRALHIGASFAWENSDDDGAGVRLRPAGRSNDGRFQLFDIAGERAEVERLNLELAGVLGPLAAQAEWLTGSADADNLPSDDFHSYYGQISYALSAGAPRLYDVGQGRMRKPRPDGGSIGAFELVARYQYAERENVPGAELTTMDFGVNYYPNNNVRFMLNYSMAEDELVGDEPDLLSLRAQLAF
jgi:phosphate-selective porin OprO/OprP